MGTIAKRAARYLLRDNSYGEPECPTPFSFANEAERVKEITCGRGVDLTLNPIVGESLKADLEALTPFGTAVVFGFLASPPAGTFADDLARHFQKSVSVRVSDIYTYVDERSSGMPMPAYGTTP